MSSTPLPLPPGPSHPAYGFPTGATASFEPLSSAQGKPPVRGVTFGPLPESAPRSGTLFFGSDELPPHAYHLRGRTAALRLAEALEAEWTDSASQWTTGCVAGIGCTPPTLSPDELQVLLQADAALWAGTEHHRRPCAGGGERLATTKLTQMTDEARAIRQKAKGRTRVLQRSETQRRSKDTAALQLETRAYDEAIFQMYVDMGVLLLAVREVYASEKDLVAAYTDRLAAFMHVVERANEAAIEVEALLERALRADVLDQNIAALSDLIDDLEKAEGEGGGNLEHNGAYLPSDLDERQRLLVRSREERNALLDERRDVPTPSQRDLAKVHRKVRKHLKDQRHYAKEAAGLFRPLVAKVKADLTVERKKAEKYDRRSAAQNARAKQAKTARSAARDLGTGTLSAPIRLIGWFHRIPKSLGNIPMRGQPNKETRKVRKEQAKAKFVEQDHATALNVAQGFRLAGYGLAIGAGGAAVGFSAAGLPPGLSIPIVFMAYLSKQVGRGVKANAVARTVNTYGEELDTLLPSTYVAPKSAVKWTKHSTNRMFSTGLSVAANVAPVVDPTGVGAIFSTAGYAAFRIGKTPVSQGLSYAAGRVDDRMTERHQHKRAMARDLMLQVGAYADEGAQPIPEPVQREPLAPRWIKRVPGQAKTWMEERRRRRHYERGFGGAEAGQERSLLEERVLEESIDPEPSRFAEQLGEAIALRDARRAEAAAGEALRDLGVGPISGPIALEFPGGIQRRAPDEEPLTEEGEANFAAELEQLLSAF